MHVGDQTTSLHDNVSGLDQLQEDLFVFLMDIDSVNIIDSISFSDICWIFYEVFRDVETFLIGDILWESTCTVFRWHRVGNGF